ncbi:uncharacterized protein LOC120688053 [Panicum virgatum]|uniref:ARM repeat superfamily protein n=1 Tax=Panicum virgatum TaxID=38727 RepID=A0A8T0MGM3_PANVG|nr:uncharacterized protein LOC120688053 [Panicum virgatum]KAG2536095.1 hypothetical protein PVAP13_9NG157000 [Panicum virgatum]
MSPGAPQEGALGEGESARDEVLQPQQEREAAGEQEEDDGVEVEEEEETPTHLPFAPSSELLDDVTTVDPSYTISLIRQLLPQGSIVAKEFSAKQGDPEEKGENSENGESAQLESKDPWEECGCILWDLAASKPQAELMMNNLVLEVLLANLHVTQSPRVKEICIGIMGNLACHESLVDAISMQNGLITTVVDQLFLDDSACLSETFRFLAAVLRSSASVSWAEALLPDEILSRVLWIVGNTLNSTLLEKSIEFLSTIIDNQDVTAILLQPLIKVGFVDHVISLLASEIEKISDESKFDRSASRDLIFHFMEELSATDICLEVMSSSDQLIQVLDKIIKLPDKFEVSSYCASVVMILANLLADGKHIVPSLSHDLPFLEGLFDILPLVCDDNQGRNALWCILARLLAQAQGIDMNSSSLKQFVSLLLGKFTLIKDDLESHRVDKVDLSAEDTYLKHGISTSLSTICCIMERWIAEKSSLSEEEDPLTESTIENARKLLNYCQNYDM